MDHLLSKPLIAAKITILNKLKSVSYFAWTETKNKRAATFRRSYWCPRGSLALQTSKQISKYMRPQCLCPTRGTLLPDDILRFKDKSVHLVVAILMHLLDLAYNWHALLGKCEIIVRTPPQIHAHFEMDFGPVLAEIYSFKLVILVRSAGRTIKKCKTHRKHGKDVYCIICIEENWIQWICGHLTRKHC